MSEITLLIDTTTQQGSIAFFQKHSLVYENILTNKLTHLQSLYKGIDNGLKKIKFQIDDIKQIGVNIGPGSFTGIRIGVSTARTIAQLNKASIMGVNSLDILAHSCSVSSQLICPVIDGRKKRLFSAFYIFKDNNLIRLNDYMDISPDILVEKVNEYKKSYSEILFLGTGLINYMDILKQSNIDVEFAEKKLYPHAKDIFSLLKEDKFTLNYNSIRPFYLRRSDAEENK